MSTAEERRAQFRVVSGNPSDAELAALTVVLAAAGRGTPEPPTRGRDRWSAPAARMRGALTVGEGAWRTAYWPR